MLENDMKHLEFVVYCIETYKTRKDANGKSVFNMLNEKGAIQYIDDNYDALHTDGDDEIIWNIEEYLRSN